MYIINRPSHLDISRAKADFLYKHNQIIQWGRKNPVRFCERFYGIEFFDHQAYVFMNSWSKPNVLWLKCRNGGKSTLLAPLIMAKGNLFSNFYTYIMAPVGGQSQETFMKIEKIAKKEISSFLGLTDFFLYEIESPPNSDGFVHMPLAFRYKLYNGSMVFSTTGSFDNLRGKRSNLNVYDEAGYILEATYNATKPFIIQDSSLKIGGNINSDILPKNIPNAILAASSASDMTTEYYRMYVEFSKRMLMGDPNYFVADLDVEVIFNATIRGKKLNIPLITREKVESDIRMNKAQYTREYYNLFDADGGDSQPFKRSRLENNSFPRLPELFYHKGGNYVIAYDPARQMDNSVCVIGKLIEDSNVGLRMEIVNAVNFADLNKEKKTPMSYPMQQQAVKKLISLYNPRPFQDYETLESLLIDSGSGGGGMSIGDYFNFNWNDDKGIVRKGLIDTEIQSSQVGLYPDAAPILKLLSPIKYKVEMFESLEEMLNLDLISFPSTGFSGKDITLFKDDDMDTVISITRDDVEYDENLADEKGEMLQTYRGKTPYIHTLDDDEQLALIQLSLVKEELTHIQRYKGANNRVRYDLSKASESYMFDDRAYCMAMLGWYLKQRRRGIKLQEAALSITMPTTMCVTALSI